MKIYTYETDNDLPEEDMWQEEDHVVSSMEHKKKWAKEHGTEDEYAEDSNRNFEIYDCTIWEGTSREETYKRVRFERKYTMRYYEVRHIEDFLVANPGECVVFQYGHFFHKTWMD